VSKHDSFDGSQPKSGPLELLLGMEALEGLENFLVVGVVEADPVVPDMVDWNIPVVFGDTQLEGDGRTLLLRHPLNLGTFDAQRDRGDMRWSGSTALHGAAMIGSNLVVQYLLDEGADINDRNALGWTPLMVAEGVFVANTEKAWPETVALLRELGAQSN